VIGQLYLQALQAQGFKVSLNQNIGPTEVTVQALSTGSLAMYPEYLDVFDTAIARDTRHFRTQVDAYEAAQRYARAHGLVLLPPTPFSNTEAIAVTDAYAEQNGLSSIGDLRHIAGTWTLGGPEQFQQLPPGLAQLRAAYGVTPPAFRSLAIGDQYDELDAGTIQAADVFTTDGELASGDYQLLADPRRIFGYGNVVPVISAKALAAEGVAFSDTIDDVDAYLTTPVMRELNAAADIAKENPADVAAQFLETHGLLAPLPGY
jgi:osmoprotectant transport system substrate-binding protein